MLVDSHIHSHYSSDCRLSPNKIAQTLRNLGLCGVLTDHYDFDHTQGSFFTFDVFEFLKDPIVKGIDNLSRGIEMGLVPQLRSIHENMSHLENLIFSSEAFTMHTEMMNCLSLQDHMAWTSFRIIRSIG